MKSFYITTTLPYVNAEPHIGFAMEIIHADIIARYKKPYKIKYCTGCELEKADSELENGKCPLHHDREIETREEENYFFKFSEFGEKLLDLYSNDKFSVTPDDRLNEIKALIDRGLEDFSISRLKSKMSWGVEVPDDPDHVMYVWFDALTSYISTLGWPEDREKFEKYWVNGNPVQFAGKDQVRQQAAMWQAMLMASGLPATRNIVIHGFLNISGQKMSKSIGNVIRPKELIEKFEITGKFGQDAFRAIMAGVNQFEDTDVSVEGF